MEDEKNQVSLEKLIKELVPIDLRGRNVKAGGFHYAGRLRVLPSAYEKILKALEEPNQRNRIDWKHNKGRGIRRFFE